MSDIPGERGAPRPAAGSFQTAVPVLVFLVVNRLAGLRWAVVAATLWSVKVVVDRRRQGLPLGKFMPIITAAVLVRGAIGAVTGSETLYFGLGIASKYATAAVLVGSVVIARPIATYAAPHLFEVPDALRADRRFHSTMMIVTTIAGLYYLISASFDVWLFRRSSVEGYVIVRFLANWPLSTIAIVAIIATAQRRLSSIGGVPPLSELFERRWQDDTIHSAGTTPRRPRGSK